MRKVRFFQLPEDKFCILSTSLSLCAADRCVGQHVSRSKKKLAELKYWQIFREKKTRKEWRSSKCRFHYTSSIYNKSELDTCCIFVIFSIMKKSDKTTQSFQAFFWGWRSVFRWRKSKTSPSSCSTSLSTPWAAGCWGPKLSCMFWTYFSGKGWK